VSVLARAGAIGETTIWSLSRTLIPGGPLHIVDDEMVDLSNLQRRMLTELLARALLADVADVV
jgi:molybdopterin/thiamine biosynthesis adenylyltransferase